MGFYPIHELPFREANKDVVLAAVSDEGDAMQYASDLLKGDRDVAIIAVGKFGSYIQYAGENLRNDIYGDVIPIHELSFREANKKLALIAVSNCGYSLKYFSDELRRDKEVVLLAASKHESSLRYTSDELRGDEDFILSVVNRNGSALRFASDELKDNEIIVLEAVKTQDDAIDYASERIRLFVDNVFDEDEECQYESSAEVLQMWISSRSAKSARKVMSCDNHAI